MARLVFLLAMISHAQTLDDAASALAAKINTHLAAGESAHASYRNLSSFSSMDKLQSTLDRALRKRVRNPAPVEITVTISENPRGFLLVAQIRQDVEMAAFRADAPPAQPKSAILKSLVWQQDIPILDLALIGDEMLVLDTMAITRYDRRERAESVALNFTLPRDPRGRIEAIGDSLKINLPGEICRGTWKPLAFTCESGGEFSAASNTLPDGSFSHARIADADLVAKPDGRVHIDSAAFDLGSDLAAACDSTRFLASASADRDSRDSLSLYELVNRAPVRASDSLEFPGPITALSSSIAVARNLSTGRYEAYSLRVDCAH